MYGPLEGFKLTNTERVVDEYRERYGIADWAIICMLCQYIENQQDLECFQDFLRIQSEYEEEHFRD